MATRVESNGAAATPSTAARFEAAAGLLEKAVKGGSQDPQILYLLAVAYKRQERPAEAHDVLRRIARPDAHVLLQMGLFSLEKSRKGDPAALQQAEQEFSRACEIDPGGYEAYYNLLLTRLTLGQFAACVSALPRAIELAPSSEERRFLTLLGALIRCYENAHHGGQDPALAGLSAAEQERLLQVIRGLGQLDAAHNLLRTLVAGCAGSAPVQAAYLESVLVQGKDLVDRYCWGEAERLLTPLVREHGLPRPAQAALFNLLGCCACLNQDFEAGGRYFQAALRLAPNDARICQNLALVYEWQGDLAQADPHWNRYFDLLDRRIPAPPGQANYLEHLAYEGLSRLASCYSEKEHWTTALGYLQRAQRIRPRDPETLERLFHLYNHAKRPEDARRTLSQLRELRPGDPQLELYELDLDDLRNLSDIERMLTEIDQVVHKHPADARVEERAAAMVGNVVPLMSNLCDQLTEQLGKVLSQVRRLPSSQMNWSAVDEVMRDLLREFQKLRRITKKCLPLLTSEEQRRILRDLASQIDRKIEACRSLRR